MQPENLRKLLAAVADGRTDIDAAVERLVNLPFEDLGFAKVDHHRTVRCGYPEVIFGQGKTPDQIVEIFKRLAATGGEVLATRVKKKAAQEVIERFPTAAYDRRSRVLMLRQTEPRLSTGTVGLVCAGTADLPVAEEARFTLEMMNQRVETFYDVGVAGLHRLLANSAAIRAANVVIVVAGMEGALPSVVGGLVERPVIAVPTSVGYGAHFGGLAALLSMVNSCASGMSVVNIDNGFGAAYQAALINRLAEPREATAGGS
jgi:pyridinium-3,5-biscarboxylic acid mononucleotide synthase